MYGLIRQALRGASIPVRRMSSFESCSAQNFEHSDHVRLAETSKVTDVHAHLAAGSQCNKIPRMVLQILREVVVAPSVRSGLSAAT